MHFSKLSALGLVVVTSLLAGCSSTTTVHESDPAEGGPNESSSTGASGGGKGSAPGPARTLSFAKPTPYTSSRPVLVMHALDFDGDGHPDIAVAGSAGDIGLMRNAGDGTFEEIVWRRETTTGQFNTVLAVGDLNRDGLGDLVFTTLTRDSSDGGIYVILGSADGKVAEPTKLVQSWTHYPTGPLLVADMGGDGVPDIIHCDTHDVAITTVNSSTSSGTTASTSPDAQRHCAVGDFNGDGRMDLVTEESGQTLGLSLTSASGTRPKLSTLYPSKKDSLLQTALYAGDVNGDGRSDVIALFTGNMLVYLGNEDGTLADPIVSEGKLSGPYRDAGTYAKLADLNGDGALDAVLVHGGGSSDAHVVSIMLGDGTGKFAQAEIDLGLLGGGPASDIAVADFDGDGLPDLAVAYGERNYVLRNTSR